MSRDEIIQQLLIETLHQIVECGRTSWLLGILEHGFAGYANLDDAALDAAARRLGISIGKETQDQENELSTLDEHEDDTPSEIAFSARYAGLPGSRLGTWAFDTD